MKGSSMILKWSKTMTLGEMTEWVFSGSSKEYTPPSSNAEKIAHAVWPREYPRTRQWDSVCESQEGFGSGGLVLLSL